MFKSAQNSVSVHTRRL